VLTALQLSSKNSTLLMKLGIVEVNRPNKEWIRSKTSLKFGANPDLSPKHVGMQWSIVDACDTVKFNQ